MTDALYIVTNSLSGMVHFLISIFKAIISLDFSPIFGLTKQLLQPLAMDNRRLEFAGIIFLTMFFVAVEIVDFYKGLFITIRKLHVLIRWSIYIVLILVIINFGVTHEIPFIYFQF